MVKITSLQTRVLRFIVEEIDTKGIPPTLREIAREFDWKAIGSAQDVVAALRKKGLLEAAEGGRARQTLPSPQAYLHLQDQSLSKASTASPSRKRKPSIQASGSRGHTPDILFTDELIKVPLVGYVQAGLPQEAIVQAENFVTLPRQGTLRPNSLYFAVEVEGYSMVNAGLFPGDLLLIESSNQVRSGEIALASLGPDREVTVKRFVLKGSPAYRDALSRLNWEERPKHDWPPALLLPENQDFEPLPFGLQDEDRIVGIVRSLFRGEIR